jgi:hypothetical protein
MSSDGKKCEVNRDFAQISMQLFLILFLNVNSCFYFATEARNYQPDNFMYFIFLFSITFLS